MALAVYVTLSGLSKLPMNVPTLADGTSVAGDLNVAGLPLFTTLTGVLDVLVRDPASLARMGE